MRQALAIISLVFTCGFSARAETLSGTVVDPQQRVIVGAQVSLTCLDGTETYTTDGQGFFAFTRQFIAKDCKIRAFHPGFAILQLTVGEKRTWTLALRLAQAKETVLARDDSVPQSSLTSVSLSGSELRQVSDNSDVLIAYAKQLAGISGGPDHLYVDGMPSDHPPPAGRIESIAVNADPFSAEYSDGSDTHIEIVTKTAERKFHFGGSGFSLGPSTHDGLNSRLTSTTRTGSFGLMGPVPYLPLAFTSDVYFTDRRAEVPIEAVVPPIKASPVAAVNAAATKNFNALAALGARYSQNEKLQVAASLNVWAIRRSNVNVSGLTLPEAGLSEGATARELRATIRKTEGNYLYRGGVVANWLNNDLKSNSSSLGVSVSGAFIGGGAQVNRENAQSTRWTFKNVLEFSAGKRYWSAGATISRRGDEQKIVPNPIGAIQFASLDDYLLSLSTGAHNGTALLARGYGEVRYGSYTAATFVEADVLRTRTASIRGGLRADYQTRGGLLLSPRLSGVSALRGFVVRAGTGMFVQDWRNDIFLRMMENDGHHLHQFLITNASLGGFLAGMTAVEPEIISKLAPNLTPAREWMSRVSVERPLKNFVPGVEYTWTNGSHFLGSERLSTTAGWTDLLESNRGLRKQQLHFRAQCRFAGQSFTAHYEWARSFDNTDGPFSFPEISGDLKDDWARSSGVSHHNFTVVGNFQMRGGLFMSVVGSWRSSAPYNITTGLDPSQNGLYNDRSGLARNNGMGPAYRNISLYVFRRFRVLGSAKESKHSLYANLGLQAENLLGNRNYVAFDSVEGSPIFGQPLSALSGRSLRLSFNLGQ